MTDENETNVIVAAAPEPKKQRAARRPKAAESALSTASVTSKVPRKKRSENAEANLAVSETPVAKKSGAKNSTRKTKAAVQAEPLASVASSASDEMADLLRLEEENKKLRTALAEKLRAENADLRKRLGQA